MDQAFPARIELKLHKCPTCGDKLGRPTLDQPEATIRVVCQKAECGYTIDLGWLGDAGASEN